MYSIYYTDDRKIYTMDEITQGSWIHMINPTKEEILNISQTLNVDIDFLNAALDEEERSRIDVEGDNILILVDTPIVEVEGTSNFVYNCIPIAIIMTPDNVITVCLKDIPLLKNFYERTFRNFSTKKKNRFVLQVLYKNATLFLSYLKLIDKASTNIEIELHKSMKNKELIQMLSLEKSLVFFATSLKSNEIVMEKLLRMPIIRMYEDDTDLLEDVIIENKQAIEMCTIYRDILSGTMDAFASIISNNLNIVMKLLTSLTIILTIPTIITSLWGMNVIVPFANNENGFFIIICIAAALSFMGLLIMYFKKMF